MAFERPLATTLMLILLLAHAPLSRADFDAGMAAYEKGDWDTALRESRAGADQGDRRAQYLLGLIHDHGRGIAEDNEVAIHWYREAATQGHTGALYALGQIYSSDRDIAKDDDAAARWFRLAAEQGDAKAQLRLGVKYYAGKGVRKNYTLAYMWYTLAAPESGPVAEKYLDHITTLMTPEELTEAQRRAERWRPKTWEELAETQ